MFWILALLVLLILFMLIRAARFTPERDTLSPVQKSASNESEIVQRFSQLIQCETVSYNDTSRIDYAQFDAFKALLETLYPAVHSTCERSFHGKTAVLYRWRGQKSDAVTVLMSHYDVVPCNEELWSKPPFCGAVENGVVWGRGTLDTKGTLCGVLEAAEKCIKEGYVPAQDVYFSFSGDEEISGPSAPAVVAYLKEKGIRPALVLDEGGAIVEGIFPGVSKPVAVIGTGEKGYLDLELSIKGQGGHSSAPPASSLVGQLAKAVVALEKSPFKAHLTPPIYDMLMTLGRHSTFMYRFVFANLWLFKPVVLTLFGKMGGEMNAMIRTTTAVTKMEGSKAFNVLPPHASVGINFRLMKRDTVPSAVEHVKKAIQHPNIEVSVVEFREASKISPSDSEAFSKVKKAILSTWDDVIVSPYLMLAASDSRHFCDISDHVLRFSAMPLSKEERGLIHGNDERITVKALLETVAFYEQLIRTL